MEVYRLVLVDPQDARNIGMVARLCANFCMADVFVVSPRQLDHTRTRYAKARRAEDGTPCTTLELLDTSYWKRSAALATREGQGSLEAMRVVASLAEALEGCERAVAFTGKCGKNFRTHDTAVTDIPTLAHGEELGTHLSMSKKLALVFGREDCGLTTNDLLLCRHTCTIPTSSTCSSLNLAMSVSVVLFTLFTSPKPEAKVAVQPRVESTERADEGSVLAVARKSDPVDDVDHPTSTSEESKSVHVNAPVPDTLAGDVEIGQAMEVIRELLQKNGYPVDPSNWSGQGRRRNKLAFRLHKHWALVGRMLQRAQPLSEDLVALSSLARLLGIPYTKKDQCATGSPAIVGPDSTASME